MTIIQEIILNIFKEVAKILDDNKIPYYAIGGTCIGAIRHKGFIPWDDDLDIAVPIEHWDKLIEVLTLSLPQNLYLYTSDGIKKYHYVWLKVCDKNTTFIEESEYKLKNAWKGIFIDIMPISGVPDNDIECERFIYKLRKLENYNNYLRFPEVVHTLRSLIGRMPFRVLSKVLPFHLYSKKFIEELKRYPFGNSRRTGYVWHPQWLPRLIFSSSVFGKGKYVPFEDTKIRVPLDYHAYLTQQFGEYMKLPPEEKRQVHNGFVDVNNPYTYYLDKDLK